MMATFLEKVDLQEREALIQGVYGASAPFLKTPVNKGAHQEATVSLMPDRFHFGAINPDLLPPTRTFQIRANHKKTINLRQWWLKGETPKEANAKKAPVFLFIHGLSGRSEWMSPLVQELMKQPNSSQHVFYGLDIPKVGQHDCGEGLVDDWNALVQEVKEAAIYLKEKHGGPVYPIGLSLGGLLLSQAIAEEPELFKDPTLLAPAYKPHKNLIGIRAFTQAFRHFISSRLHKKSHEAIPFRPNSNVFHRTVQDGFSKLQIAIHKEKETAEDRVQKLTLKSYLGLLKFMYRFRNDFANKIQLPMRIFVTEADDLISTDSIKTTFARMPAQQGNALVVFQKAAHDLINDPVNPQIAASIEEMLRLARQKSGQH